ncbi:hypothetical protein FFV08_09280 [Streptococcus sanguinis]|uniref:Uncharacterized protein n=1 Tax=Streptococcus sanguinis TaxID=1305 RepID=A0A7H8V8U1_STRSA|nr:hypothetical protein FFV08_09280 [Streptococcus sanguinis]
MRPAWIIIKISSRQTNRKVRKEGKPNEIIPAPGIALSIENKSRQAKAPKMMPDTKKTDAKITMVK